MRTVAFSNQKGGVGKTTINRAISSQLAIMGYRVLMIDADPQASLTVSWDFQRENSFYSFALGNAPAIYEVPQESWLPDDAQSDGVLYLMPGSKITRELETKNFAALAILENLVQLSDAVDWVFFDTSPTPSMLHDYIYMALDDVVMPTKLSKLDVDGLSETLKSIDLYNELRRKEDLPDIFPRAIIPNMTRLNTAINAMYMSDIMDYFGKRCLSPIANRTAWDDANQYGVSIFRYDNTSQAANDARRMTKEFLEVGA